MKNIIFILLFFSPIAIASLDCLDNQKGIRAIVAVVFQLVFVAYFLNRLHDHE